MSCSCVLLSSPQKSHCIFFPLFLSLLFHLYVPPTPFILSWLPFILTLPTFSIILSFLYVRILFSQFRFLFVCFFPYSCLFSPCSSLRLLPFVSRPYSHCLLVTVDIYLRHKTTNNSACVHLRFSMMFPLLLAIRFVIVRGPQTSNCYISAQLPNCPNCGVPCAVIRRSFKKSS